MGASDTANVLASNTAPFAPFDGTHALYLRAPYRAGSFQSVYNVAINNIPIPAGSTVSCTMAVKWVQNDNPPATSGLTAALYLDNYAVNNTLQGTGAGATLNWKTLGGRVTVNNLNTHSLILQVRVPPGNAGKSVTIAFDALSCFSVDQCSSYQTT